MTVDRACFYRVIHFMCGTQDEMKLGNKESVKNDE